MFRGYNEYCKKWIYGFHVLIDNIDYIYTGKGKVRHTQYDYETGKVDYIYYDPNPERYEVITETVSQFTGEHFYESFATDNPWADACENRIKCFVGDILRICMGGVWQDPIYVVKDLKSFYEDFRCDGVDPYYRITDAILIGNIHDNPKLLERK